ncbi:hypothetical protein IFM89_001434 [Coptis chinensis]|uniref:Agenet domain-containing protein n=1 Tax=Coptis chinensis TaxID=261450 RepID=A0A835H2M9_9MAGN|nr:hypothetical protein IFM89_001434 [Coptis chinensis]
MERPSSKRKTKIYSSEKNREETNLKGPMRSASGILTKDNKVEVTSNEKDDNLVTHLRELVDIAHIRPLQPNDTTSFRLNQQVDAFWNDGWWKGVVIKVFEEDEGGLRYRVYFETSKEEMEFEVSQLRLHLEYVDGKWVNNNTSAEHELPKGKMEQVEVSLEDKKCHGAWFPATISKKTSDSSILVEYKLRRGDKDELMTKSMDSQHIRPCPPPSSDSKTFDLLEKVDAFYDCGWWSGVVTKVLANDKYNVFFKYQNEQREFKQSDLRLHMDWIDGKWVCDSVENVGITRNEGTVKSSDSKRSSVLHTGVASQLIPSEDMENFWENMLANVTDLPSEAFLLSQENMKQSVPEIVSQVSTPFKKVRDKEATKVIMPIKACVARGTSAGSKTGLESLCFLSSSMKGKRSTLQCRTTRNSIPTELFSSSSSKRYTEDNQTENVSTRKLGQTKGSGNKRKSRSTKSPSSLKILEPEGPVHEPISNGKTDFQTRCSPTSSYTIEKHLPLSVFLKNSGSSIANQNGGPEDEALNKEMTIVPAECMQLLDPATEEHDIPFLCLEKCSSILEDNGENQLMPMEAITEKEASMKILKQLTSSNVVEGSHNLEETFDDQYNDRRSSVVVTTYEAINPGPGEASSKRLKHSQSSDVVHSSLALEETFSDQYNNTRVEDSHDIALDVTTTTYEEITPADVHIENVKHQQSSNLVDSSFSLEEIFIDADLSDDARGDESALRSSIDVTATISSPLQQDGGTLPLDSETLPFLKKSHLWGTIESVEVFKVIPQRPHFRPLQQQNEEAREGMAMGFMVILAGVMERTCKAQFDEPRSMLENKLNTLTELEEHGFTVQPLRDRLDELLRIKERCSKLDDSNTFEREFIAEKGKSDELQESINQLNSKLQTLLVEREKKCSVVAELQMSLAAIKESIQSFVLKFDSVVTAPCNLLFPWKARSWSRQYLQHPLNLSKMFFFFFLELGTEANGNAHVHRKN